MLERISLVYTRLEPFIALFGALGTVCFAFIAFSADMIGVDRLLLLTALARLGSIEYIVPLGGILLGCGLAGFVAWNARRIQLRAFLFFVIAFCLSIIMFRSYVLATIGPKIKVDLFNRISQLSCEGKYADGVKLVDQIINSPRLSRFKGDAAEYRAYLEALQTLKKSRETNASEAREPFELAQDQILFGIRLSHNYVERYRRETPLARAYERCGPTR